MQIGILVGTFIYLEEASTQHAGKFFLLFFHHLWVLFSRNSTRVSNSLDPDQAQQNICKNWVQTVCNGYKQITQPEFMN